MKNVFVRSVYAHLNEAVRNRRRNIELHGYRGKPQIHSLNFTAFLCKRYDVLFSCYCLFPLFHPTKKDKSSRIHHNSMVTSLLFSVCTNKKCVEPYESSQTPFFSYMKFFYDRRRKFSTLKIK